VYGIDNDELFTRILNTYLKGRNYFFNSSIL